MILSNNGDGAIFGNGWICFDDGICDDVCPPTHLSSSGFSVDVLLRDRDSDKHKDGGNLSVCKILIKFQDFNCVSHDNY